MMKRKKSFTLIAYTLHIPSYIIYDKFFMSALQNCTDMTANKLKNAHRWSNTRNKNSIFLKPHFKDVFLIKWTFYY